MASDVEVRARLEHAHRNQRTCEVRLTNGATILGSITHLTDESVSVLEQDGYRPDRRTVRIADVEDVAVVPVKAGTFEPLALNCPDSFEALFWRRWWSA